VCTDCGECSAWIECSHRVQKTSVVYKYPCWSGPGQRGLNRELEEKIKAAEGVPGKELEAMMQAAQVTWHPVVLSLELGASDDSSVALLLHSLQGFKDSPASGGASGGAGNEGEEVAAAGEGVASVLLMCC